MSIKHSIISINVVGGLALLKSVGGIASADPAWPSFNMTANPTSHLPTAASKGTMEPASLPTQA